MKNLMLSFVALVLACLAWMGFVREPLPSIPVIRAEVSKDVNLDFSINSLDLSGVELALNNKIEGKGMYVQFQANNTWKTGRPGLIVKGIMTSPGLRSGKPPKEYLKENNGKGKTGKDFSDFMNDNRGNSIATYTFQHTLVEGDNGKTFMRMSYNGPVMDMIQTLDIERPITIPAHVSRQFLDKGIIQFQPGVVAFDSKIKGFYIPVVIR